MKLVKYKYRKFILIFMGYKIVLTADRTLMSEYNKVEFIGFAACFPKVLPQWLYSMIFCPKIEDDNGRAKFAHCGTRKIESALLENGFSEKEVIVANPTKLNKILTKETKVLGITTNDPLGLGPASSTFSSLIGKESYNSIFFKKLISNPKIRKYNIKVIVGGQGSWQLADNRIMRKYNVDCVVNGEGELIVKDLFEKAINGEQLPPIVEGDVVPVEKIPLIKNPTINGLVEIARGCGRGCEFCSPTMLKFRSRSIEEIMKEVEINVASGTGALLHAEDVLRYGANGFRPNEEKVIELFSQAKKYTDDVGMSHISLASALSSPNLIKKLSEILITKEGQWISVQVGIETGSSRLASEHLRGKAKPFDAENWSEVVKDSFRLLNENYWSPCCTLIMGLPKENERDIEKTNELILELRKYRSLIVPLFFVPIGKLEGSKFFTAKEMKKEHWKLLANCINHNFYWIYDYIEEHFKKKKMQFLKERFLRFFTNYMKKRISPYLKMMEEGINPIINS